MDITIAIALADKILDLKACPTRKYTPRGTVVREHQRNAIAFLLMQEVHAGRLCFPPEEENPLPPA